MRKLRVPLVLTIVAVGTFWFASNRVPSETRSVSSDRMLQSTPVLRDPANPGWNRIAEGIGDDTGRQSSFPEPAPDVHEGQSENELVVNDSIDPNESAAADDSDTSQRFWAVVPDTFDRESRDSDWAAQMESRIYGELSAVPELAATTLDVECRESTCLLSIHYPAGTNAISAFQNQILPITRALPSASVSAESTPDEDVDAPTSRIYLMFDRGSSQGRSTMESIA